MRIPKYGYKECFTKFDLDLIKKTPVVRKIKPEMDRYF